jgi:hypothetical protein
MERPQMARVSPGPSGSRTTPLPPRREPRRSNSWQALMLVDASGEAPCQTQFGVKSLGRIGDSCIPSRKQKPPIYGGFERADDGIRTHDLLHGKRVVGSVVLRRNPFVHARLPLSVRFGSAAQCSLFPGDSWGFGQRKRLAAQTSATPRSRLLVADMPIGKKSTLTSTMSEPADWRRGSARWTPRHTRRSCPCAGLFYGRNLAVRKPADVGCRALIRPEYAAQRDAAVGGCR